MYTREQANDLAKGFESGYWTVGEECFFNKSKALLRAAELNTRVGYYYFDHLYKTCVAEPTLSLRELYFARARALRSKYDYIAMAVSGGSDSSNMVHAFLSQGLHIDEIYGYFPVKAMEKTAGTSLAFNPLDTTPRMHMYEYQQAFLPLMERVQALSPRTKITVLDFTEVMIDAISQGTMHEMHFGAQQLNPTVAGPYTMFREFERLNKPNSALVIGIDKPRLLYDTVSRTYGFFFMDFQNFWSSASVGMGPGAPKYETFYYTPSAVEIIQKQYFVVRAKLRELQFKNPRLFNTLWRPSPTRASTLLFNMQEEFFEHIIYPDLPNHGVFQTKKPTTLFYNEDAAWFLGADGLGDKRAKDYWDGQVKEFISGIDSRFIRYEDNKPAMFRHCPTKSIHLP